MTEITYQDVVRRTLNTMGDLPTALEPAIRGTAATREVDFNAPLKWMQSELQNEGAGAGSLIQDLGMAIRNWDRLPSPAWAGKTAAFSAERRALALQRLKIPTKLGTLIDNQVPRFTDSQLPVVIADQHAEWYSEGRRQKRYYWENYRTYLARVRDWKSDSLDVLDEATDQVISRLADPSRRDAYAARGLVVGYVQSGKTAHFTGVLAKAADAGYRLIIVLAGTLDVLRTQTQRRIDKELLGQELVAVDYENDADWDEFHCHGGLPSQLGYFDWDRLTGPAEDFQALSHGIAALEFVSSDKSKPLFDPVNLQHVPVRLVVIKKHPSVIRTFTNDLARIKTRLGDVPTLVIDDESDQASLNTQKPEKAVLGERTATNKEITSLLSLLPRGQYVGYTATPFANVLVDPDEEESLFPRDFIVALPRPDGYMGVSDFHDLGDVPEGFASKKRAFVREVEGDDDHPDNLRKALDSFVLAGALKLYRAKKDPAVYRFKHHTMLIHLSEKKHSHRTVATQTEEMFNTGSYHSARGLARLQKLFVSDFISVSKAQEPALAFPRSFAELHSHVAECVKRLNSDKAVRIVNGDHAEDTPDFDQGPVWSILVGGTKLSRGYTVEGLTVSYFRRVAKQADSLMQMGRWFGFRAGYRDLVRLFIATKEPLKQRKTAAPAPKPSARRSKKSTTMDLYEAFQNMCLDEEEFRQDIRKYVDEKIRPIDVPPLVPSHLEALMPTAPNKMFNAQVMYKNLGGKTIERTVAPKDKGPATANYEPSLQLLAGASLEKKELSGVSTGGRLQQFDALVGETTTKTVLKFLREYKWEKDVKVMKHEVAYLEGAQGDPGISKWRIIAPQLKSADDTWPERKMQKKFESVPVLSVKKRQRDQDRFKVYSEPVHVSAARFIAGIDDNNDLAATQMAEFREPKTAVLLMYPVTNDQDGFVTIGFALCMPSNDSKKLLVYKTIQKGKDGKPDPVTIDRPKAAGMAKAAVVKGKVASKTKQQIF